MKKKLQFLLSLVALMLVATFAQAQVTINTDLTSQFSALTNAANWTTGAGGKAGTTATNFCPMVEVGGGIGKKQVCEFYESRCTRTGDLLYQTVSDLAKGTYTIELYGGAAFTFGRGFGSQAFTGEVTTGDPDGTHFSETYHAGDKIESETGVTLYAATTEGTVELEIPIYYATDFPEGAATATLKNVVVGDDGKVTIGLKKTSQSTNWHIVQLKSVIATVDADDALAVAVSEANNVEKSSVPAAIYEALQTVVTENNKTYDTAAEYETAIANIRDAVKATQPYSIAKPKLESIAAALANTNFYVADAYQTYYANYKEKYDNGTLTLEEANALEPGSRVIGSIPNILLTGWTIGGNDALPTDKGLYINTWSIEGDNDGTEFRTPFYEYWTPDANSLNATTITATLENIPAGNYAVEAWVRVRMKNGATAPATGITFQANDGKEASVADFAQVGTSQFYIKNVRVPAVVGEDGKLVAKFNVAADNNISWLSFQNVNYITAEEAAQKELAENYASAQAALIDGNYYQISTTVSEKTYYLKADGKLTAEETEATNFLFKAVNADGTAYATGWNLGSKFTNPTMSGSGGTGDPVNEGGIKCENKNDRNNYERQVFFLNQEGEYAVRATNASGTAWGANTFWTALTPESELPQAGYSLTESYVWNLKDVTAESILADAQATVNAAKATVEAKANVGTGLFEKPEEAYNTYSQAVADAETAITTAGATVDDIKAAIATLEAATTVYNAAANAPKEGQAYVIANTTATGNLSIETGSVKVKTDATVYFTAVEGGFVLSNENDEYIFKTTNNNWTLSTTTDIAEAYKVNINIVEGGYTIQGEKGLFGLDNADEGSAVYANKTAANHGIWTIAEYVAPAPTDYAPTVAGTYEGTISKTITISETTSPAGEDEEGTITIAATETANEVNLTVTSFTITIGENTIESGEQTLSGVTVAAGEEEGTYTLAKSDFAVSSYNGNLTGSIDAEGNADITLALTSESLPGMTVTAHFTGAIKGDEPTDLTADMFYTWNGYGADASSISAATVDFNVGTEVAAGGVVAGTGTVDYLTYADLTGSTKLIFEGTTGTPLRVLMNRQESNNGPLVEKNPIIGDDGKAEVDLTDLDYVHINAIKIAWAGEWGNKGTITSIKFLKPSDPLAIPKELLKSAIAKAKLQNAVAKTEESFSALTAAIAAGEKALTAADATEESMETATKAINDAIEGLKLAEGYSNLTAEMFKQYASLDEPGEGTLIADAPLVLGTASDLPYGDVQVSEVKWADLAAYDKLVITIAGDVKARLCMNRLEAGGQQAATKEDSKMLDINPNNDFTWSTEAYQTVDGNTYTIDLAKIVEDYGFARLHSIKKQGYGAGVVITGLYLYKTPEAAPTYSITIAETENGTVEADKAEAEEGATVTITVTPAEGYMVDEATYSYTLEGAEEPTVAEIAEPEEGNAATITMPAADVTVNITFKAIEVEPETPTIAATLVHTAASFCGDPAGVFTSTVDTEAEHVNNSNFGAKWAGAAYADFSLATLPAGATITKATLTFTGIGESRNARNTNVQYVNQDLTLDYTALGAGNANVNLAATDITSVSFPKYTEETKSQEFTIEVTDILKDIAAKQNYIIFKWTGNQGGGDVAGKASENAPTLVIEYIPGAPEIANASFEEDGEKAASNGALELTGWTFGGVGTQFNNTELRPAESESTTSQFGTSAPSDGEYSLFFRQGWNGGGNTITLTSDALAEIPAGDYVLSVDYKQHYSHDGSANENTKVGIALVNGENTIGSEVSPAATGVNGGSADATYFNDTEWSTLEASFSITEAIPAGAQVVITLYSAGQRRSDFFLDNVQFTKVPGIEIALIDLKKAIEAAEVQKNTYSIGDGLFQYPESEIEPLTTAIATAQDAYNAAESKAVVEAATQTLNDAVAGFAPQATTPDPEKQYTFQLKLDGETPLYMNLTETGITIAEEATPLSFVETETAGQYNLVADELYVGLAGGNAWTMSTVADKKAAWTFTALGNGEYYINNLVTAGRFIGTNAADKEAGKPCYADKQTSNGNVVWIITEYVEPTEKTIEIAIERIAGQGYTAQTEVMDFTEGLEFLGAESVTWDMLRMVEADGTLSDKISNGEGEYDGWFNKEGYAQVWGDNSFVCVKMSQAQWTEGQTYEICDMGSAAAGDEVTAHWALVANDKTVFYNFKVTFVEAPAPELAISDVKVKKDVIYDNTVTSNYAEQIAELTDEEVQSILTELNLTSLDEAKVYGYNPSDESFVVAYAGFDGWRDANGDFAMHTGTTDVPACCKYTDGKSYPCYNIAGVGDKIVKTYWAIANDEKAVLVEVDFWFGDAYTGIDGIAAGGKTMKNGRKYMENGKIFIYRNGKKFSTTGVELK